ncbi:cytochrome P450 [Lophiotrema nucula]|uniref:Cytochrome P450 n=1 Tax=Lophiotrema nucula TaxID=690887 RepID=A0A6A5YLI7_9PLEO|nr:cytochrome P450 [Lophiotrema nucula]
MAPDHSFLFGHLKYTAEFQKALPESTAINTGIALLHDKYPNGVWYLDVWPFSQPLMVITSPITATQMQKYSSWIKPVDINDAFMVLCAGNNTFSMTEQEWKPWRSLFNPSFSASYMLELAPLIAREAEVLCSNIRRKAQSGGLIEMETLFSSLALDVIGSTSLETTFGHQIRPNYLATVLRRQVEWFSFGSVVDPWKLLNPFRPLVIWNNKRVMRNYLGAEIDKRYAELKHGSTDKKQGPKSIISLALKEYASAPANGEKSVLQKLPYGQFKATLIGQIIMFMLAGHETTSTTMCFCFDMLFRNPETLRKIRAEHDEVFGSDRSQSHICSIVGSEPERLNKLSYTLAVIKETLRLQPPVSSIHDGNPAINLTDDNGVTYPTDGMKVWVIHTAIHRNPKYWKEPDAFIPERWLAKEGDPLYPFKGAWRPFEFGSRNCIGQSLALMELKLVLLMACREFDVTPAYEKGAPEVYGSPAYMVQDKGLGGKCSDGFPCTVSFAKA